MGCGGTPSRMIFREFVSRRTLFWRPNLGGEATILRNGVKNKQRESPFVDGAKRFCNYKAGGDNQASRGWKRWIWHLETAVATAFFGVIVGHEIYDGSWETVPYTKRRQHLVHRAPLYEKLAREFEETKKNFAGVILRPLHPDSVRVQTIARNLIEASRREGGDSRIKRRWEVLVVDSSGHGTLSSQGGGIFVFRGVLNYSGDDAEIAAFIAHLVGAVVPNHAMEINSMVLLVSFLFLLILHVFVTSKPSLQNYFRFPLTRSLLYYMTSRALSSLLTEIYYIKMDLEAEYIGLMLLASAGYDPQLALQAREKMIRIGNVTIWQKIRARRIVLHMDEALSRYREAMAGQNV